SQRAESNNSRIKERGDSKGDLKKFNLHQISDHIFAIIRHQEFTALSELKALVQKGKSWSSFVDQQWREQLLLGNGYRCTSIEVSDGQAAKWAAQRYDRMGRCHIIKLRADGDCESY